jgi:hypothetical protein
METSMVVSKTKNQQLSCRLREKTELMISSQAIKYKAWKLVKSNIMLHPFMARMG